MSEENKIERQIRKLYECIGLLSSMISCGEDHTSRSKDAIADARAAIDLLETENAELRAELAEYKRLAGKKAI